MSEPRIIVNPVGNMRVEGDIPLFDHEGNRIPTPEGKPYHLCRCGHSSRMPFCDSTHKRIGWTPEPAAE